MEYIKVLLSVSLIFFAKIASCTNSELTDDSNEIDYRLPSYVIPEHYSIALELEIDEFNVFSFIGSVTIYLRILVATRNITLHLRELEINERDTYLYHSNYAHKYYYAKHNYYKKMDILVLTFDDELIPGSCTLKMYYSGPSSEHSNGGFYKRIYVNKEGEEAFFAGMQYGKTTARQIFPCWDEPGFKATYGLLVKHSNKYVVLSNREITLQIKDTINVTCTNFNITHAMSTHFLTLVIFDKNLISNSEEMINMWYRKEITSSMRFSHNVAKKVSKHLSRYTNISLEDLLPKLSHVILPDTPFPYAPNWGLIVYRESEIIHNVGNPKMHVAYTVASAIAYQWFYNLVTPSWWTDLWLSVGLIRFFTLYALDQIFEDWKPMDFIVLDCLHNSLLRDTATMSPLMSKINNDFDIELITNDNNVGDKASALLRMLQHLMTEEVFQDGIKTYLNTFKFSTATSDDFWLTMQTVFDESDVPHDHYKIKEVMDTWTKQSSFPLVTVTRNYDTGETIISQKCFCSKNDNETDVVHNGNKWWIPVTFATQTNPDFSIILPNLWLKPLDPNISLQIDPNDWIIVNLQQIGYYRVNYDLKNWQKIAHYLNSEEFTKIHVLNRAQIVEDVFALVLEKKIDASIFFNITSYLQQEIDFAPWNSVFRGMPKLVEFLPLREARTLRKHLKKLFNGLLKKIEYCENAADDDLTKIMRIAAAQWACHLGNSRCKDEAAKELKKHFADPDNHKIAPSREDWVFCCGLMNAKPDMWLKLHKYFSHKSANEKFLTNLICAKNHSFIINYIGILDPVIIKRTDAEFSRILSQIIHSHARNFVVLEYILKHLRTILTKSVYITVESVLKDIISHVYFKKHFDMIRRYTRDINELSTDSINIEEMIKIRLADLENLKERYYQRFTNKS